MSLLLVPAGYAWGGEGSAIAAVVLRQFVSWPVTLWFKYRQDWQSLKITVEARHGVDLTHTGRYSDVDKVVRATVTHGNRLRAVAPAYKLPGVAAILACGTTQR